MFGQRLRLARKKAGLSMQALGDSISPKISAQAISKYEADKMMPSSAVLLGLSQSLGVSIDFLMGGQVKALDGVEFRKHSGTSARDRAQAEARVIERLEDYLAIEDILELESNEGFFDDLRCDSLTDEDAIDAKARELRQKWKLGIDPIPSMTTLLEDKGIKVIEVDLPERINGLACQVKRGSGQPDTQVIVISSRTNVERKRFTLAHELAHRIITATGNPKIKLEKAMNRFAGAFLVPGEHLKAEAGGKRHRMAYDEIIRLKLTYGVSAVAMLMRLGQVGILPQSAVDYAFRSFARPWRNNEPEPIIDGEGYGAFEKPQRYERLVWRALGEELISPARAAQMLQLSLKAVEEGLRGPRDQWHAS